MARLPTVGRSFLEAVLLPPLLILALHLLLAFLVLLVEEVGKQAEAPDGKQDEEDENDGRRPVGRRPDRAAVMAAAPGNRDGIAAGAALDGLAQGRATVGAPACGRGYLASALLAGNGCHHFSLPRGRVVS